MKRGVALLIAVGAAAKAFWKAFLKHNGRFLLTKNEKWVYTDINMKNLQRNKTIPVEF